MKKILKGYRSLFREMLNISNDASFLSPPANLIFLIAICGIIGLLRNSFSIWLHVLPGFYSFHPDMIWTMFIFPVQLCLFPSALLHWLLQLMGYRQFDVKSIYGLSFHLQILHLIIPFLDWLGYRLGMPWAYTLGTDIIRTHWYTNLLHFTPGVIVGWWITGYMIAKVLRVHFGIHWWPLVLASLTTFLVILVPTYFLFPTFNTLFNKAFGLWYWYPQDYFVDSPTWFLHWGYGTYFGITSVIGLVYYLKRRSEDSI